MRAMVGPGRRWSYRGVSRLTGIDERSLKAYAAGTSCPNLAKYKRLLAVLGPELAAEIDPMFSWPPRVQVELPPEAVDLAALCESLRESLRAVDALLDRPAPRRRRITRRDG
jgi:predicted transcriptional regulator